MHSQNLSAHKTTKYAGLYLILLLLLVKMPLGAQTDPRPDPPANQTPAAHQPTLFEALAGVPLGNDIALTVRLEEEADLPEGTSLPATGASFSQIATAFGRMTRRYGTVLAVAPATMTVLNTAPANPDLYADLTPPQALKYLASLLTPGQQAAARRATEETGHRSLDQNGKELHIDLSDPTRKVTVWSYPNLQLLAPSLNGPIETQSGQFLSQIFDGSREPAQRKIDSDPSGSTTDLRALLEPIANRAVLAEPHTVVEVNALAAQMKELGMNQLWLVVFSNGRVRVPGTPFSLEKEPDLLAAALKVTAGSGIGVYPVIDVFTWGAHVVPALADLTILGEN